MRFPQPTMLHRRAGVLQTGGRGEFAGRSARHVERDEARRRTSGEPAGKAPMKKSDEMSAEATQSILDHWRRVAPNDRLAHLIRHASRGLRRSLEFRLAEHEVSFGQWMFLRILWREDGLSQRELSVRAGVMEPTTHTAITRMESLGLVEKRPAQPGGRRLVVCLSERGRALEEALTPLAEEVNLVALRGASEADVDALRRTLLLIVGNLAEDEEAALSQGMRIVATRRMGER